MRVRLVVVRAAVHLGVAVRRAESGAAAARVHGRDAQPLGAQAAADAKLLLLGERRRRRRRRSARRGRLVEPQPLFLRGVAVVVESEITFFLLLPSYRLGCQNVTFVTF